MRVENSEGIVATIGIDGDKRLRGRGGNETRISIISRRRFNCTVCAAVRFELLSRVTVAETIATARNNRRQISAAVDDGIQRRGQGGFLLGNGLAAGSQLGLRGRTHQAPEIPGHPGVIVLVGLRRQVAQQLREVLVQVRRHQGVGEGVGLGKGVADLEIVRTRAQRKIKRDKTGEMQDTQSVQGQRGGIRDALAGGF